MHDLYSIQMPSPNDGWAVGGDWYYMASSILHWDGLAWTIAAEHGTHYCSTLTSFPSLTAGQSGHGRSLVHWDGTQWTVVAAPQWLPSLHGVAMVSGSDGWAVGGEETILRWDGHRWASFPYTVPVSVIRVPLILHN